MAGTSFTACRVKNTILDHSRFTQVAYRNEKNAVPRDRCIRTKGTGLFQRWTMSSEVKVSPLQDISDPPAQSTTLLGYSAAMNTLRQQIHRLAVTEASVFIVGESGTGKELAAQEIHALSQRKQQIFLPINCGAISPQLLESELFGHEKGSFTSADRLHKGYFERASGGTLFLNEIMEMPVASQVKLLRVLETKKFVRIGGNQMLDSDVRIIAATNQCPVQAIAEGRFRLDLYHRLNILSIQLPSLRERIEDIELLARYFLNEFNQLYATKKILSLRMICELKKYSWPGNVRELRNFIHRACILSNHTVDMAVPQEFIYKLGEKRRSVDIRLGTTIYEANRHLILSTLLYCGGVKKKAADLLGISLKSLYNRLEDYKSNQKLKVLPTIYPFPVRYETSLVGEQYAAKSNDHVGEHTDPQLHFMRELR